MANLKKPKSKKIPALILKPIGRADATKELLKKLEERRKKIKKKKS